MDLSAAPRMAGRFTIALVIKVGAICICLLDMWILQLGLRNHWSVLSSSEHRLGIMILVMYPLPCLHFREATKEPISGALLVLATYFLLGAATDLIFR